MRILVVALVFAVAIPQDRSADSTDAALSEFAERLKAYLKLRDDLEHELEPLAPVPSSSQLQAPRKALVAAIRNARARARPGDLIPASVQELIRQAVHADWARRNPVDKRAALVEVPEGPLPGINRDYPHHAAFATIPPLLLANLPRLPDNLQYRFFGRHMVVLDADAEIIIDYVRNTLPR